jgi:AraC-like DNA-binding protein
MPEGGGFVAGRGAVQVRADGAANHWGEVPYKLSHQVPLWTVQDVQYWISKIGFKDFAASFEEQMVDGDLLLLLSDDELREDLGMSSRLLRKRFRRELDSLKVAADYSCIDETQMDRVLMSASPSLSIYTYRLLEMGVDTSQLPLLSDEMLAGMAGISNPIHRRQILAVGQECAHAEDMELTILRKHIDVFISYRRSTGNQLASLIKVLLQLRGHKVFIDVDRLYAGKFDSSLLKNIQAASHFILVLTPLAMDRLLDDQECEDWVHKEIRCAIDHHRNVIPVFDPAFQWPDESRIPPDIRAITRFNGVRWVHEYQEACVDKLERFRNHHQELLASSPSSPALHQEFLAVVRIPVAGEADGPVEGSVDGERVQGGLDGVPVDSGGHKE